jgi:hypothetical protein
VGIVREQAIVYRGGGRRWFSAKSAARAAANKTIRERCECDEPEYGEGGRMAYPGNTCELHNEERYPKILRRLARLHLKHITEKEHANE